MMRHKAKIVLFILFLSVYNGRVLSESSYYYSRYITTWAGAREDCEHIGGFLVKLEDLAELRYLTDRMNKWLLPNIWWWVGLSDIDVEMDFHWTDGSPFTSPNLWHPGQPDSAHEDCVHIYQNLFNDLGCSSRISFVCEVDDGSELAKSRSYLRSCYVANDLIRPVRDTETYDQVVCPRNKIYFSPSHWKNFMTWSAADAQCKLANGNLAKITSADEQLMVDRFRNVKQFSNNYWIGGTDSASEGLYTWADGELVGGDGGWPSFPTTTEPAADLTRNCVATGGTGGWYMVSCGTKYPVLCEIDADLVPNQQSCYWVLNKDYWTTHQTTCVNAGGHLAHINNVRHLERLVKVSGSIDLNFGIIDAVRTWHNTLTDGSELTWSKWQGNREPNSINAPYGVYKKAYKAYWDEPNYNKYNGLCEKQVIQYHDADILHTDNGITVTCHADCPFQDGSTTKTWTCAEIDVADPAGDCICKAGFWTTVEPWLSYLNMSAIQDNDNSTCITPTNTKQVMTLSSNETYHGYFETDVVLSPDLEHVRKDVVRVFVSDDLSFPEATCRLSGPLSKCKNVAGSKYACTCSTPCHVYVKLFQTKETTLTVCEITA